MQAAEQILDAGQLFETHRDRIYWYVLHLIHSAAEAEDLTPETFLRAHRKSTQKDSHSQKVSDHLRMRDKVG